jgi:hypothetical protein
LFGLYPQFFSPSLNYDVALGGVKRDNNCRAAHSRAEPTEKWGIYLAILECGTSDNDVVRSPIRNFLGALNGANSSADTHFHAKSRGRFAAQFVREFAIMAFPHGGIQIDDVQPLVFFELQQQGHYIRDRKLALSAVHELHRPALLQVDTRN